jgi:phosphoglycerol transferase MdoB-like AlkP superfamily enzyme
MRLSFTSINAQAKFILLVISINFFAVHVAAQENDAADANAATENVAPVKTDVNINTNNNAQPNSETNKPSTNKKMVQDATISLQTTITGNQEQPKVLYILPWQSPQTECRF